LGQAIRFIFVALTTKDAAAIPNAKSFLIKGLSQ